MKIKTVGTILDFIFESIHTFWWCVWTGGLCIVSKEILDLNYVFLLNDAWDFIISCYAGLMVVWLLVSKRMTNFIGMLLVAVSGIYILNVYSRTLSGNIPWYHILPALINVGVAFLVVRWLCNLVSDKLYIPVQDDESSDYDEELYKIKLVERRFRSIRAYEEMFADSARKAYKEYSDRLEQGMSEEEKTKWGTYIREYNKKIKKEVKLGTHNGILTYFYGAYFCKNIGFSKKNAAQYLKEMYHNDNRSIKDIVKLFQEETKDYEPEKRNEMFFEINKLLESIIYGDLDDGISEEENEE